MHKTNNRKHTCEHNQTGGINTSSILIRKILGADWKEIKAEMKKESKN
jgi:hypothetical protein